MSNEKLWLLPVVSTACFHRSSTLIFFDSDTATSETDIDPQLRSLPNSTSACPSVPEEQAGGPRPIHQRRGTECEAPQVLSQVNVSPLGATPQVTPHIDEDGESKLKELHEAANRSQSRKSVYYYPYLAI